MKRIDLLTVLVSSLTLLLFCLCSYILIWQYSLIRDDIDNRTEGEIQQIIEAIEQLEGMDSINRVTLADRLESNIKVLKGNQEEWQLLRKTLTSFVTILVVIVLSHLFFVYTLFSSNGQKNRQD